MIQLSRELQSSSTVLLRILTARQMLMTFPKSILESHSSKQLTLIDSLSSVSSRSLKNTILGAKTPRLAKLTAVMIIQWKEMNLSPRICTPSSWSSMANRQKSTASFEIFLTNQQTKRGSLSSCSHIGGIVKQSRNRSL